MAITGAEVNELRKDFQNQSNDLIAQGFYQKIGLTRESEFLDLMDDFEEKVLMVANSELFSLNPSRLPFLMVFPPSGAANEDKLKERLAMLGFSATLNQIQVRLSKIEDVEDRGSYPYIIFDVDPGHLIKTPDYAAMILQRMHPTRRRLTFFEAVSMAPKISVNFQVVINGARYVDEDTAPAIDFAMSKAAPIINHFDLNNVSARIGIPSCVESEVYKPKPSNY